MHHTRASGVFLVVLTGFIAYGCSESSPRTKTQVAASSCPGAGPNQMGQIALAKCLATPGLARSSEDTPASSPSAVVLYVDRSGSMRGFLDPGYPTQQPTDYRAVIDKVAVGLHPIRGFSFGARLQGIAPSLATLSSRSFYSDADTKMGDVFAAIANDTSETMSHVIIGDGRRGAAPVSIAQFVQMRDLADRWVSRGGEFVVATTLAPFKTVASDPSGCRKPSLAETEVQRCPLYAFAFVRRSESAQVRATLATAFEQIFAWPTPLIPPSELALNPVEPVPPGLTYLRRWAVTADSAPIARITGAAPSTRLFRTKLSLNDTTTFLGHANALVLAGEATTPVISARGFDLGALAQPWQPVTGGGALVSATDGGRAIGLGTHGPSGTSTIYRIDLAPTGEPSWLLNFDAQRADDVVRTYGLGLLFESFRIQAQRALGSEAPPLAVHPLARVFVVAN